MKRTHTPLTKGFTVIEILIATSIFAVIMIAALLMYDRSNKVFKDGVEAADVQQNTRIAFDKIVADLRMAGFDFDRDGTPSVEGAYQSPDEQIEYISNAAITLRANYDYNDDPTNTDNGREFTPGGTPGSSGLESVRFPVVTTGNDEIVTFALVSADASQNDDSITFYADVPDRAAHPESGGRSENEVVIDGVDLSNANPPYTLQRITIRPGSKDTFDRSPIATNIRSMNFEYFEDQVGADPLSDLDGTDILPADYESTVGGDGQFNPASASVLVPRQIRGKIQSIKVILVGQTENPDPSYTDPDPAETAAPRHRKYRLESLVVPRNYGRRGFKEQDYVKPDPPTITRVCVGYCGVAYVEWSQPATGGAPEDYQVRYGPTSTGPFPATPGIGITTFDKVQLPDPTASYYFQVVAINSYGAAPSPSFPSGAGLSAMNDTKPNVAEDPAATGTPNQIRVDWTAPDDFASGAITCTSGPVPPDRTPIEEFKGFSITRSLTTGFDPAVASGANNFYETIYDAVSAPAAQSQKYDPITRAFWIDDMSAPAAPIMGPANCYPYYYRIKTQERCTLATQNTGSDPTKGESADWTAEVVGTATSDEPLVAPQTLEVDDATSLCDPGTGYCTVRLKWAKVNKDLTMVGENRFLSVGRYIIYRQAYRAVDDAPSGGLVPINARLEEWVAWIDNPDPLVNAEIDFSDPSYVTFVDTQAPFLEAPGMPPQANVNEELYNIYYVVAQQCGSPESDPSPTIKYPCVFTPNVITQTMSGVIEGTGEQTSPWLIQPTSELTLAFDTTVDTMVAEVVFPDATRVEIGNASGTPIGTFPWDASLPDGAVYRIDVTVTTLDGCRRIFPYWVESTATNCCLTPVSIDTRLLQENGPGQKTLVRLQNRCSGDLTLTGVRIAWNPAALLDQQGQEQLEEVVFPASAQPIGTCPSEVYSVPNAQQTNSVITVGTLPAGARSIIPPESSSAGVQCHASGDPANGSDDYEIEIRFNKSYDPFNPAVTQVCITYIADGALGGTACQILPDASTTAGVCDTP